MFAPGARSAIIKNSSQNKRSLLLVCVLHTVFADFYFNFGTFLNNVTFDTKRLATVAVYIIIVV